MAASSSAATASSRAPATADDTGGAFTGSTRSSLETHAECGVHAMKNLNDEDEQVVEVSGKEKEEEEEDLDAFLQDMRDVLTHVSDDVAVLGGSGAAMVLDLEDVVAEPASGWESESVGVASLQDSPSLSSPSQFSPPSSLAPDDNHPPQDPDLITRPCCEIIISHHSSEANLETGSVTTLYNVRVEMTDGRAWEVQHTFGKFRALSRALRELSLEDQLPPSWANLSWASLVAGVTEDSPAVVQARISMLTTCFEDLVHSPTSLLSHPLLSKFLNTPPGISLGPPPPPPSRATSLKKRPSSKTKRLAAGTSTSSSMDFGTNVRLSLDVPVIRPEVEQAASQKWLCHGCKGDLPKADGLLTSLGLKVSRAPRRCFYTGKLYCHSCHHNTSAIIPSSVLHSWDFTPKFVCSAAAEYLDSISQQPVLCIAVINPALYSKIPELAQAYELRSLTTRLLNSTASLGAEHAACVSKLRHSMGGRTYLVEGCDFWSLEDLKDLALGATSSVLALLGKMNKQAQLLASGSKAMMHTS